jgi:hypothetical protein
MKILLFFVVFLGLQFGATAQNQLVESCKVAFGKGDIKVLSNYLNDNVSMSIDDEAKAQNKQQTENALQSLFSQNKGVVFSIVHEGTSKEGKKFVIGNYASYRVTINYKSYSGNYMIDAINFAQ